MMQILEADHDRVKELVDTIVDGIDGVIPGDTPSGYVLAALCLMLRLSLERAPPEAQEQVRVTILRLFAPEQVLQ